MVKKQPDIGASNSDRADTNNSAHAGQSDFLSGLPGPELVIGLVGPLGSNLTLVSEILQEQLARVDYKSSVIKASQLLHDIKGFSGLSRIKFEETRIGRHMDAGNTLRRSMERGDALALLSVAAVCSVRKQLTGDRKIPKSRFAYVLRSFKHPDEIKTLRKVYGRGFIQISAYSPRSRRCDSLAVAIAKSHHSLDRDSFRSVVEKLISRDEAETSNDFGQNVRDTFPLADVIINAQSKESIVTELSRFIEIFFGHPFHTPTVDEYGMIFARTAASRSADLSRQVGAVITSPEGEILAAGCNEVPKTGGGQYWPGDKNDLRDFRLGYDSSAEIKREMLADILHRLKNGGWLSDAKQKKDIDALVEEALRGGDNPLMSGTQLMSVLEFGRIVHAEMAAITDAARSGRPIKGCTLYSTTFPCHICARHIVASGIKKVVYVEPYPKSMAANLYPDSISVDGEKKTEGLTVEFKPFVGVASARYLELFEMSGQNRKSDDSRAKVWRAKNAEPRLERIVPAYLNIEDAVIVALAERLKSAGLETRA